jgi:hypothetical protein
MENSQGNTLADIRWIPLDGEWEKEGTDELVFTGGEYDPPESEKSPAGVPEGTAKEPPQKFINFGTALFDRHFKEGQIGMQVEACEKLHRTPEMPRRSHISLKSRSEFCYRHRRGHVGLQHRRRLPVPRTGGQIDAV